ncbi:hypothetical protein B0H14DRAFT_2567697 [Mycena olivaceomarginata]|nr:hypothetical protein B0H14DRAFT_2567697 [Mycena olivaceomarginata]
MDRLPAIRVSDSDDGFQSQSKQGTNVVGSTSSTTRAICLAVFLLIAIILIGCMTKRSLNHRAATEMGVMQLVKRPRLFEANIALGRQVGGVTWGGIMPLSVRKSPTGQVTMSVFIVFPGVDQELVIGTSVDNDHVYQ